MRASILGLLCAVLLCCCGEPLTAADGLQQQWQESLLEQKRARIQQWIRQLDASPPRRVEPAKALRQMAREEGRELVLEQLYQALGLDNEQLREGVIDTLGLIGDKRSIPVIARQLRFDPHSIVRLRALHQLPTFLVRDLRLREGVRAALGAETYAITDRIRAILRKGSMSEMPTPFGPASQALRDEVRSAVAGQLDPVGSVIEGFASPRDAYQTQRTLSAFFGKALGETADEWREAWRVLESEPNTFHLYTGLRGTENLQIASCRILSDIGAEGTESVCAKLERLIRLDRPDTRETALRTIVTLAMLARESLPAHRRRIEVIRIQPRYESELVWQRRRVASGERIQALAWKIGQAKVDVEAETYRARAYLALAAGVPEGESDQATAAIELLHERRIGREDGEIALSAMAEAFSHIGTQEAVRELAGLAARRSHSGRLLDWQVEYRVVQSAIKALAALAARPANPGAASAFEELLSLRGDETVLRGGPLHPDSGEGARIGEIATHYLHVLTGVRNTAASAEDLRTAYARKMASGSKVP